MSKVNGKIIAIERLGEIIERLTEAIQENSKIIKQLLAGESRLESKR